MGSLAVAYKAVGKQTLSMSLFEKMLPLLKTKFGPEHPATFKTMSQLAEAYRNAGKVDRALPLEEEMLKVQRVKLGPDHPDTLNSMANLGLAYESIGKLAKALPMLEETLQLRKAKQGPDHLATLTCMNNLAAAYWSAHQLDKSVPLFEETLKRREKKLGRQHVETQRTLANLGVNYMDAGRLPEAIPLLEEAYQAAKKYPTLSFVNLQLLVAYTRAGENANFANVLREQRQALPKGSPQLAQLLASASLILFQQKKSAESEPLLRECLAIRAKKQPDAWTTFNTQSTLGGALLAQKKYAEAEPLLLKGYEGMKAREKTIPQHGGTELRIPEALDRLIELYTATNKADEAKRWQAERAKYPQVRPAEKK
jgi:tetratricopeptide (TPR) repeat protein